MSEEAERVQLLEAARSEAKLQLYVSLYVVIDGSLQAEEQHVDVRFGPERVRVYMRSAVPAKGLEWDGSGVAGTSRTVRVTVFGPGGEAVVSRDMRCRWFAVRHDVHGIACARAIFECGGEPLVG
jgi:hypothetical protein